MINFLKRKIKYGGNNTKNYTQKRKTNNTLSNRNKTKRQRVNILQNAPKKTVKFANEYGNTLTHIKEYEPNGKLQKFRTASTTRRKIGNIEQLLRNTNYKRRYKAALAEIYGNVHSSFNEPANMLNNISKSKTIPDNMKSRLFNKIYKTYVNNTN